MELIGDICYILTQSHYKRTIVCVYMHVCTPTIQCAWPSVETVTGVLAFNIVVLIGVKSSVLTAGL